LCSDILPRSLKFPPKENIMRRVIPIVLALVLMASVRTSAQVPTAQKWENVEWSTIMNWQFVGPQVDTALTIWFDVFMPAVRVGFPGARCFRHITGEAGVTCIFPMPEGPAGLEWETPQAFVDFFSTLAQREGEAVAGVFETFGNAIESYTSQIVLEHTGGM
jgi:hypothetical protein